MKAWSQPGFYYLLGKLPLPAHLSDQACTVIVASGDGTLQVTSQASAVAGQHTTCHQGLTRLWDPVCTAACESCGYLATSLLLPQSPMLDMSFQYACLV